jgi:hypothetical protein
MACRRSDRSQLLCGSGGLIGNEPAGFGEATGGPIAGITGVGRSCKCVDVCSYDTVFAGTCTPWLLLLSRICLAFSSYVR